jgi:protocatechuate 3,4-dioxygenase beta subunit
MVLGQGAAPPAVQLDAPPEPSWTISGRVTDRDSGQPLPRARVSIRTGAIDPRKPPMRSTITDAQGFYEIPGVPAGMFTLMAQPPPHVVTHLPQVRGDERPYDPGGGLYLTGEMALRIKGADVRGADIRLARALAIEGRVVNDDGDPVAGVLVSPIRIDRNAGEGAARHTDDRGQFRLFGLVPGLYRVCASTPGSAAQGAAASLRQSCLPQRGQWLDLTTVPAAGLELKLPRARSASVSGTVVDAAGTPLERGDIQLVDEQGANRRQLPIERLPGGRFIARNVEPGDYKIVAVLAPESPLDSRERELVIVPVTVGTSDVDNLLLQTRRPARVSGVVTFEGDMPFADIGRIQIRVQPREVIGAVGVTTIAQSGVRPDATFELGGLLEPARLVVAGFPPDWVLKAVFYHGRDVTDALVEFESSTDPRALEIVLTNRGAQIRGSVLGSPERDVVVIFITAERSRWTTRAALTFTIVKNGRFQLGPVRAGDYFVVAAPTSALAAAAVPNPAMMLEGLVARASRIVLVEGETRELTLSVSDGR